MFGLETTALFSSLALSLARYSLLTLSLTFSAVMSQTMSSVEQFQLMAPFLLSQWKGKQFL